MAVRMFARIPQFADAQLKQTSQALAGQSGKFSALRESLARLTEADLERLEPRRRMFSKIRGAYPEFCVSRFLGG